MPADYTELATRMPPKAPLKGRPVIWWLGITPDIEWARAAAIFERRYGYAPDPEQSFRDGAIWHVGPIREVER